MQRDVPSLLHQGSKICSFLFLLHFCVLGTFNHGLIHFFLSCEISLNVCVQSLCVYDCLHLFLMLAGPINIMDLFLVGAAALNVHPAEPCVVCV